MRRISDLVVIEGMKVLWEHLNHTGYENTGLITLLLPMKHSGLCHNYEHRRCESEK